MADYVGRCIYCGYVLGEPMSICFNPNGHIFEAVSKSTIHYKNMAVLVEQLFWALIEQAKRTAKLADGVSDNWRWYIPDQYKPILERGELLFGKVE